MRGWIFAGRYIPWDGDEKPGLREREAAGGKVRWSRFRRSWEKPAPPQLWAGAWLVAILVTLPILYLILRVASNGSQILDLYLRPGTFWILARTIGLALAVTLCSILTAVPLAWLTTRTDIPLRKVWATAAALPMVIPSYVGAYLFIAAFGPGGILSGRIGSFPVYGFTGSLIVLTLLSYPTVLLSVRAAFLGMDPGLEEASRSLGAGLWRTYWRVILPQLKPALGASGLLVGLYVLRDFGAVSMLRYDTFTRIIYLQYRSTFDRTAAAGLALILAVLTLLVLAMEMRLRSRVQTGRLAAGDTHRQPATVTLGRWKWLALAYAGLVVTLALILPMAVLLYWVIRGVTAGEVLNSLWGAAGNAMLAAGLAAVITTAAAMPVAWLSVRYPGRWSRWIERLSYAGYGLPGIVIALALVFFVSNFALPFYGTLPILLLAYLILFLPQSVGSVRTSLLQVNPRLEEAARSLGKNPAQVFRQITLPLIRPGLASGAALVFLTTMKELPATLLLSPLGFSTLATSVWSSISEAFFARAAAPALLLVLMSSLPMAYFIESEKK